MKFRFIITIIFFLFASTTFSQEKTVDVVYLNNGSIIKGSIIEYFVDDYILIESASGSIHRFTANEIKNVNADVTKQISLKNNGFYNNTSFGVLLGENNFNNPLVNFTFSMVNGYQINKHWQAGLGLGMDVIYKSLLFPVFFDTKFYLRKSAISPFLGMFIGYSYQTKNDNESDSYDYYYYRQEEIKSGRMYGVELGIRNYTKENIGYTFSVGYRFQYLSTTYDDWQYNVEILEEHYLNRFKFTLGILFN